MKVALIIPSIASVKAFFIPLILQAQSHGVGLTIFTSKDDRGFRWDVNLPDNVAITYIKFPSGANPVSWFRARKQLKGYLLKNNFDLVHAHFTVGIFLLSITQVSTLRWGTFHGVYHLVEKGIKGFVVGLLEKAAIKVLDQTFVLNEHDYKGLSKNFSIEKVPLPGVGVDLDTFNPSRFSHLHQEKYRSSLGINGDCKVLLFVGRFTSFKGVEDALRVIEIIREDGIDATLLLCGLEDSNHPLAIGKTIGVINLGWRQDIAELMNVSDCLIFPSVREGLPVSLMEAIAMQLPYAAYEVRGVVDLHTEYGGGLISPTGDVNALAENTKKLINHKYSVNYSNELLARKIFVEYQLDKYNEAIN